MYPPKDVIKSLVLNSTFGGFEDFSKRLIDWFLSTYSPDMQPFGFYHKGLFTPDQTSSESVKLYSEEQIQHLIARVKDLELSKVASDIKIDKAKIALNYANSLYEENPNFTRVLKFLDLSPEELIKENKVLRKFL